jgi:riboflavin-specific deaminase-like protein
VRQLFPQPGETTPEEATSGLGFAELAPPERPYLVLNMVSTVDGRIAIAGRSGAIGNDADRELFHGLRTQADAVMAGAGTVRTERYGRLVRSPERRERRALSGLAADPLAIVVSARFDLPPDLPLLQSPESTVVVLTAADREPSPVPAQVEVERGPASRAADGRDALVMRPLLERLRAQHGVRSIVCEGGPRLNDGLLREGLVDELWMSLAPKIAGGNEPTLVVGAGFTPPKELELVSLLESEDHLFLRYRVGGASIP